MAAPSDGLIGGAGKLIEAAGKTNLTLAALLALMVGFIGYTVIKKQTGRNAWQGIAVFLVISAFSFFLMLKLLPSAAPDAKPQTAVVPPPQSDLVYVQLLSKIGKADRGPLCLKLADEKKCADILALIDDIVPPPITGAQKEELVAAIDKGDVTAAKSVATSITAADPLADKVLTTGSSTGWDVDVFWCEGLNDAKVHARATLVGQALAGAEGGKLGDHRLGRISVKKLASARQGQNGLPSSGLSILMDDNPPERRFAIALLRYVQAKNGTKFNLVAQHEDAAQNYYLSLFVCS